MIAMNISPSESGFELAPLKPFGILMQAREPGADPRRIPVETAASPRSRAPRC